MTSRREDGDEACRGAKGDGRDGGTGPGCLPYRVHVRFRTLVSRVSAAVASRIGIAGVPGGNLAGSGSWFVAAGSTTTDQAIYPDSKGLFVPVLEPGFGRRSRVVEPGQNVPRAKKSLCPTGFEPKTYCLAHDFLANSPK